MMAVKAALTGHMKFATERVGWLIISLVLTQVCLSDDESELKSIHDGLLANAECWKRYDVFSTIDCIVPNRRENPNLRLYESEEKRSFTKSVRLAIDHETEQVFMFSKLDLQDVPADSELRPSKDGIVSVCQVIWAKGGKVYSVAFPGGEQDKGAIASYMDVMQRSVAPDLRCIGLGGLNATFGPMGSFQRALLGRARRRNPDEREVVSDSKEEVQFTISGKTRLVATQRFAKATMLPIQFSVNEAIGNDNVTLIDEHYTWKEFDGVFVPESVINEETQILTADRRVSVFQTLEAYWMSFGEPIDPKLFELAERKEYSKLLKSIDSVALGVEKR